MINYKRGGGSIGKQEYIEILVSFFDGTANTDECIGR